MKTSELIEKLEALGMDDLKHQLFHILAEYAATPIEEREEEKKYQFRFPGLGKGYNYLNISEHLGEVILNNSDEGYTYKTSFTQSEIDDFPDDIKRLISVAERIEVRG